MVPDVYILFQHATSKGLVCGGGMTISLYNGERAVVNDSEVNILPCFLGYFFLKVLQQGTLIPSSNNIHHIEFSRPLSWVLVVEKDVS
jgi:hypothetical protein